MPKLQHMFEETASDARNCYDNNDSAKINVHNDNDNNHDNRKDDNYSTVLLFKNCPCIVAVVTMTITTMTTTNNNNDNNHDDNHSQ